MLEIGSLFGLASAEELSLIFWQTSFLFCYLCLLGDQLTVQLLSCLLQCYFHLLYYSAVTLLVTFLISVSLTHSVQYYSYSAILYFYYNICSSYSCLAHTICPARDAYARMRLYWDGPTCAQASLKCSPIQASPNPLTSDLRAIVQQEGLKPNNIKKPTTFKLATPLRSWEKDRESKQIPHKLCPQDQR